MPKWFDRPKGDKDDEKPPKTPKPPKIPGSFSLPDFSGLAQLGKVIDAIPVPRFGDQLRNYRTLRGKSIEELATEVDLPPTVLRDLETGSRPAPPKSTVVTLADALKLQGDERESLLDAADLASLTMRKLTKQGKVSARPVFTAAILVFLIADIRGYTRFTQEHGDTAAAKLTGRFSELAYSIADQYDGRVIEVRGDEVLAVFASARQALLAAHMLQARCAEEATAYPDLPLRIGVGLDVGEPIQMEDGGYRGAALNRAARLCSLAGPGDVLVSTGVAHIAPQVDGITYVHRGSEELKGIEGPTPILLAARTEVMDTPRDDVTGETDDVADE
jgi:adenylate cyclase